MEKQTIVIEYVGEVPSHAAVAAAFESIVHNGTAVDATVQPTITHLTEKEVVAATAIMADKLKSTSKGVTIAIEKPRKTIVFSEDKKEKFFNTLAEILNG